LKIRIASGATLAAAAAVLITSGAATSIPAQAKSDYEIKCFGLNACKGHGSCKSTANACKGKNACKGQGFSMMGKEKCMTKGGSTAHS
jgi:hypothetical protein